MKTRRQLLIYIFLIVSFILFFIGTIRNTSWDFKGFDSDSPLEVKTSFPNADCVKTLKKQFPFYEFHCTKKEASSAEGLLETEKAEEATQDKEKDETDTGR